MCPHLEPDGTRPKPDSLSALEKILQYYPAYKSECSLDLATFIDYTAKSDVKQVSCYEFKKIRILLSNIEQQEGFPARIHHTVAFFDLLMFSIPFYHKLFLQKTMEYWDKDGLEMPDPNNSLKVLRNSKISDWRWRKVWIHEIPNELFQSLFNMIPYQIESGLVDLWTKACTTKEWSIFENLITFAGLHNKIIICNWDKVLKKLNDGGM
jgi:hypothetical protein